MNGRLSLPIVASLLAATTIAVQETRREVIVVDAGFHHLGNDPTPEWTEASNEPEGARLDLDFEARGAAGEGTLFVSHRSIGDGWRVLLNGQDFLGLSAGEELVDRVYPIPAGLLKRGSNRLSFVPKDPNDDVTIGAVRVVSASMREVLDLVPITVRVREKKNSEPVPARVTIVDAEGEPALLYYVGGERLAVRYGLLYTAGGEARFEVPRGAYTIYATRGMEWSLGASEVSSLEGPATAELTIEREVDTRGYVACDTHIHTLTFSGHGDALFPERLVTLAGEGVELAIATDHNHHTDYSGLQKELELDAHYTAVVGNEVTTEIGHFNAFPLDPKGPLPDHELTDHTALCEDIRAKGADVIILNHPRWPSHEKGPFGVIGLDRFTGERRGGYPLEVDAMELVNSTTSEDDPLFLFVDWFALMNRGERVRAVGSSDSHTVGDPVGQGRTYIPSATDDPARIDVEAACAGIVAGRTSVALGIFTEVEVAGGFGPGDVVPMPAQGGEAAEPVRTEVRLRIAAASWVRPRRAVLYLNGTEIAAATLAPEAGAPFDQTVPFEVDFATGQDAWLVCVVLGDGITQHFWPTLNDYTLGATNPVFFDVDGDGEYTSPHGTARVLFDRAQDDLAALARAIERSDEAVALQLLSLVAAAWQESRPAELALLRKSAAETHPRVGEYLASLAAQPR